MKGHIHLMSSPIPSVIELNVLMFVLGRLTVVLGVLSSLAAVPEVLVEDRD